MYHIEVVWNRESHFSSFDHSFDQLDKAISFIEKFQSSGHGDSIKKSRILDDEGMVVYQYGQRLKKPVHP